LNYSALLRKNVFEIAFIELSLCLCAPHNIVFSPRPFLPSIDKDEEVDDDDDDDNDEYYERGASEREIDKGTMK